MRSPVGRDDAEEATVHIVVEKHYLRALWMILPAVQYAHAAEAGTEATVSVCDLALAQIFDLPPGTRSCTSKVCCRPVQRLAAARLPRHPLSVATAAWRGARRRWATKYANGTVRQRLGPHEGETSTVVPCPIQVGLAIRQVWRRFRRRCCALTCGTITKDAATTTATMLQPQKMMLHGPLLDGHRQALTVLSGHLRPTDSSGHPRTLIFPTQANRFAHLWRDSRQP